MVELLIAVVCALLVHFVFKMENLATLATIGGLAFIIYVAIMVVQWLMRRK